MRFALWLPRVFLYVDEFQHFATQSFIEMLSEARKYGLNLIMAQQSTQQQGNRKLTETLLANTGTLVTFRTGSPTDADLLTPFYSPFIGQGDLANAASRNFYMKTAAIEAELPISGVTKLPTSQMTAEDSKDLKRALKNNLR